MGIVKVNRSGSSCKVYATNAGTEQSGTIGNNEMFTWTGEWSGGASVGYYMQGVRFRNKAGKPASGWMAGKQSESEFATNICALAKFKKVIGGKTYYGFTMRRDEELYAATGAKGECVKLSKVAYQGRNILCASSTSGHSYPERLAVVYLETGIGTGNYVKIDSRTTFVDLGYDQGSMFNKNCSLIGSI